MESVKKKLQETHIILAQINKYTRLLTESEICKINRNILKYECRIRKGKRSKKDYLWYIHYGIHLIKRIKQRKEKCRIGHKGSDIHFNLVNKINCLYENALLYFDYDLECWAAYIKFCKFADLHSCIDEIFGRMLKAHYDKSKSWHFIAHWEMKENNDLRKAKGFILQGLRYHPDSKLLLNYLHKLEFGNEKAELDKKSTILKLKGNSETLWDMIALRELEEQYPFRDCISNCYQVYETAVSVVKTRKMWSLFINCMVEIYEGKDKLPKFKRKLLVKALKQGHLARKLNEEHYSYWIKLLRVDNLSEDSTAPTKLYKVLCWATKALPKSEKLWFIRYHYLIGINKDDLANEIFNTAVDILGENSFGLWRLRLLSTLVKKPELVNQFFEDALKREPAISNYFGPIFDKWLISIRGC